MPRVKNSQDQFVLDLLGDGVFRTKDEIGVALQQQFPDSKAVRIDYALRAAKESGVLIQNQVGKEAKTFSLSRKMSMPKTVVKQEAAQLGEAIVPPPPPAPGELSPAAPASPGVMETV